MNEHGGVGVVDPPNDDHDRPESKTTAEKSAKTSDGPSPGPAAPRFREHIGKLKAAIKSEGGLLKAKAGVEASRGETNKAVESEPWLRVGTPSEGDINHVAQVHHPNFEYVAVLLL